MRTFGAQSTTGRIRRVIVKRPAEAFRNEKSIQAQWKDLNYTAPPDLQRASHEHQQLMSLLDPAEILYLPEDSNTTLDSLYPQDAGLIIDAGAIVFQTGKEARRTEGAAMARALREWDIPVIGEISGLGMAEGGDLMFLDHDTLLAGRGFRTNAAGLEQLGSLLDNYAIRIYSFDLSYSKGPQDVFHLMSFISLLDENLALVYRPLMPVPLYQLLMEREIRLIDIAEEEYESQACNVLAVAPRDLVMIKGNPFTRRKLEEAGCRVREFEGNEISWKGCGGPTCLIKVLLRE